MSDFYRTRHIDGTSMFKKEQDEARENDVAKKVQEAWGCEVCFFGRLCPVDWYARHKERMIGLLELKGCGYPTTKYPSFVLSVRKWISLINASIGLAVPAIVVADYEDALLWVPLAEVDATNHRILRRKIVRNEHDIEPVIDIDVAAFYNVLEKNPLTDVGNMT